MYVLASCGAAAGVPTTARVLEDMCPMAPYACASLLPTVAHSPSCSSSSLQMAKEASSSTNSSQTEMPTDAAPHVVRSLQARLIQTERCLSTQIETAGTLSRMVTECKQHILDLERELFATRQRNQELEGALAHAQRQSKAEADCAQPGKRRRLVPPPRYVSEAADASDTADTEDGDKQALEALVAMSSGGEVVAAAQVAPTQTQALQAVLPTGHAIASAAAAQVAQTQTLHAMLSTGHAVASAATTAAHSAGTMTPPRNTTTPPRATLTPPRAPIQHLGVWQNSVFLTAPLMLTPNTAAAAGGSPDNVQPCGRSVSLLSTPSMGTWKSH